MALINVDSTLQFAATVVDASGDTLFDPSLVWVSSDVTVATVDSSGLVDGVAPGSATIFALWEGEAGRAELSVAVRFAAVSAGGSHSCGLTARGTAFCWGDNESGQLGDGRFGVARSAPVRVAGGLSFASLTTGSDHTCALTSSGSAYCWGGNSAGQLGFGLRENVSTPIAVAGRLPFAVVSAGDRHTCGVTPGGVAYCWGENDAGQLGNGSTNSSTIPVAVADTLRFTSVSAGGRNTCGLTPERLVYCWGSNDRGQLGTGMVGGVSPTPMPVLTDLTFSVVSVGRSYTCAMRPPHDYAVHCWGTNDFGQLGDGSLSESPLPVQVSVAGQFFSLDTGGDHACGVVHDFYFGECGYCWGRNEFGQLGIGTLDNATVPVMLSDRVQFEWVSAGALHSCGITTDSVTYCWGRGDEGQLGSGEPVGRTSPVRVAGQG